MQCRREEWRRRKRGSKGKPSEKISIQWKEGSSKEGWRNRWKGNCCVGKGKKIEKTREGGGIRLTERQQLNGRRKVVLGEDKGIEGREIAVYEEGEK